MICEIVKLWVILVPHPKSQLCLQLVHVVSCGWWRSIPTWTYYHPSTNHYSSHEQVVGKVVVLGVAPEFFSNYFRSPSKTSISLSTVNLELLPKLYGRLKWDKTKLRFSILRLWLFPLKRKYFQVLWCILENISKFFFQIFGLYGKKNF